MTLQIRNPQSAIRNGFTLVEMLVVLVVALVVTTLVVMATLRMGDKDTVPAGAGMLQGYLAKARTTALAERRPVGVRLLISAQNPPGVTGCVVVEHIQYIHDPGDFADGYVEVANVHPVSGAVLAPGDRLYNRVIAGPPTGPPYAYPNAPYQGFTFTNGGAPALHRGPVLGGDAVEFNGGGQMFRVNQEDVVSLAYLNRAAANDGTWDGPLTAPTPAITQTIYAPTETFLGRTLMILDRPLQNPIQVPNVGTTTVNYRIMRQPRPIPGEEPIKLPRNAFIVGADLNNALYPAGAQRRQSQPAFATDANILFDPSGRVVATDLESISLWVSDVAGVELNRDTNEPLDTNWAIVSIKTRTGSVSVYPAVVPGSMNPPPVNHDYYFNARSGRGAGM